VVKRIPWPVRSVVAGSAGTAALGLAYALEHRWRRSDASTDYDDSDVPGQIVANILHLGSVTERTAWDLGLALRWSYGSAFGIWHGTLRRRVPEPVATGLFGATLLSATLTMFPLLGHTPPPWRWPRGYLATCLATHATYAITVGVVDDRLRG
jgi:hypothetical protein